MNKINISSDIEIKILKKRIDVLEKLNSHYKDMEEKVLEARMYAENIVETVTEPLIIMDGELKIISANKSFYAGFKVNTKDTVGRYIYELGNGQWDIPILRKMLKEIITKRNSLDNFEIEHTFESIGHKIMLLNARRIPPTPAKPRIILLAIEDITYRKEIQREVTATLEDKIVERTKQLDVVNQRLKEKISDLEIINKAAVGRELKIIELKKEVAELRERIK